MSAPSKPTVSAIIAAHNGEKYLRFAIESVLNQDYPRYDLWVIDNGSTDATPQVAQLFPQVHYRRLETANVAAARNQGVYLSQGEYLAFLDQDDLWAPNKLTLQTAFLQAHQELFLEPGCKKPRWLKQEFLQSPQYGYIPSGLMVRRSALREPFEPALKLTSDVDWFFKMFDAGLSVATLSDVLVKRRIHSENNSNHCSIMHKELLLVLKQSVIRKRGMPCIPISV
jgi:glycosyltransferase involved in cell wall biosynthesis